MASSGFTLSSPDKAVRRFWIDHGIACRKIAEAFGRELGNCCITNFWVPDGFKDTPFDRLAPRERLRDSLMVVKRDGRLEEFSRSKLANGIERSLLKRPVSLQKIEAVIDQIVDDLESRFDLEIPAQVIGDTVMAALLKMDEVAYVRYASIYRHYEDVDQFIEEVRSLKAAAQREAAAQVSAEPERDAAPEAEKAAPAPEAEPL